MNMIAIASDVHLGYKQYGLAEREDDFESSIDYIIDECIKKGIKAIFSPGDFINSKRPTSRTIDFLFELERKLKEAGVVLYVLSGNHDYCKPTWFEVIEKNLKESCIKSIDNKLIDLGGITVYGYPYFDKNEFLTHKDEIPMADILLCHIACKEFTAYPSETAIGISDIELKKHKYVFIGDTHINKEIEHQEGGKSIFVISPGATELNSDSEDINKYYYTVEKTGRNFQHKRLGIKTRKLIRFNIQTQEDLDHALEFIKQEKKNSPLLVGSYNNELENAGQLIFKLVKDTKIINHLKPTPSKAKEIVSCVESEIKRPIQYVEEFFAPDSLEAALLVTLLQSTNPNKDAIESFVERKRQSLKISS